MSNILKELDAVFTDSFMKPKSYYGWEVQDQVMEAGLDLEDDKFYCQLSASGFMDQTDLTGPFDTLEDCAEYLIDTYGD